MHVLQPPLKEVFVRFWFGEFFGLVLVFLSWEHQVLKDMSLSSEKSLGKKAHPEDRRYQNKRIVSGSGNLPRY